MRTHGFGIIGAGVIAPFHARAIGELPNARLVAVADVVPEAAAQRAAEFGVEHAADVDALLARPDVDVAAAGHGAELRTAQVAITTGK
jgi:UDP-N-acetyl-2-amino-2-deoxyglucuronate dehydrogenase